jgi:protoheme IX farnesyltransferase
MNKFRDYIQLTKPSLNIMVVFSSVVSFMLTPAFEHYTEKWKWILLLFAGGYLVTGGANAINMAVEKDTDALMSRTKNRPVAAGRLSQMEAWTFAVITGVAGVFILGYFFNWTAGGIAALSLFLYAFIYTPLKKVNSIAVLVGAFPGSLPCLIGWAAGEGELSTGGWILFGIQFLWQFPHFWAICWIAWKDYLKAGFKLLPSELGPTKFTAIQAIIFSTMLLPVTLLPFFTGMCSYDDVAGIVSLVLIILANAFMILRCVNLYRKMDIPSARKVMFGSYMYLPVILLALYISKVSV